MIQQERQIGLLIKEIQTPQFFIKDEASKRQVLKQFSLNSIQISEIVCLDEETLRIFGPWDGD